MAGTLSEPVLQMCPERCGATGANVYRAAGHPLTCPWMMREARRCSEHDELLRPDELECPHPATGEEDPDPHRRLS